MLGVFGLFAVFVAPWIGAGALLAAAVVGLAGLLAGGAAAASGEVEPRSRAEPPRLPAADEPQGRTD